MTFLFQAVSWDDVEVPRQTVEILSTWLNLTRQVSGV
jgi:hypothetical protein